MVVSKFNVTNWEGRVGSDPNIYNVTLLDLFFLTLPLGYDDKQTD